MEPFLSIARVSDYWYVVGDGGYGSKHGTAHVNLYTQHATKSEKSEDSL